MYIGEQDPEEKLPFKLKIERKVDRSLCISWAAIILSLISIVINILN